MELIVAVVVTALAAAMMSAIAAVHPASDGPIDTEAKERRLVRWLHRHPALHRFVRRHLTREEAGAGMVATGFVLTLVVAAVLGLLLRAADSNGLFASWDKSLSEWGVRHAETRSVDVLEGVTQLGSTMGVVIAASVVAVVDVVRRRNFTVVAFLAVVVIGQSVLCNLLKAVVGRDRPDVLHLVPAGGSSFPSGHTTAAAACWAAIALVTTRRSSRRVRTAAAAGAALIAVAVGASRALLGVHWATDVMAGWVLGWSWFLFVGVAFGGRLQRFGEPAERLAPDRPRTEPEVRPARAAESGRRDEPEARPARAAESGRRDEPEARPARAAESGRRT